MRVIVEIEEDELEGDYGPISGLRLTCKRCGYDVEVYGTEQSSASFGAMKLRGECPKGEQNFYVADWDDNP